MRALTFDNARVIGVPPRRAAGQAFCVSASTVREPSLTGRMLRATGLDDAPGQLSVRPGITGWAQVMVSFLTPEEKKKLNECYVPKACFSFDVQIAVMTLLLLIRIRMSSSGQLPIGILAERGLSRLE
jgi:hypothetical protein